MGGLGNQMFQYAAGRRLAHLHQTTLKLDVSYFSGQPDANAPRSYRLGHMNVQESFAAPEEIRRLGGPSSDIQSRWILRLLRGVIKQRPASLLTETQGNFCPEILNAPKDAYLVGYWQSEKYFHDVGNLIKSEFRVKSMLTGANAEMAAAISSQQAVSIHVRRGDYASNPTTNLFHGLCSLDYYAAAVAKLTEVVPDPHFYVFSDDPEWIISHLRLDYPTTYVTHTGPDEEHEDLRLMTLCRHHIIANSSFSWWGAWLCDFPGKIVIAPRKWFNDPGVTTRDLIPESWIRI